MFVRRGRVLSKANHLKAQNFPIHNREQGGRGVKSCHIWANVLFESSLTALISAATLFYRAGISYCLMFRKGKLIFFGWHGNGVLAHGLYRYPFPWARTPLPEFWNPIINLGTRSVKIRKEQNENTGLTSPPLKYFNVGKDWTFTSSTSFVVESILAIKMSLWSAYFSPSLSQIGANCLQWPHHGASKLIKAIVNTLKTKNFGY